MLFGVESSQDATSEAGWASSHGGRSAPYGVYLLLILFLVALPVRVYLALGSGMISRDGGTFIWYAQAFGQNPIAAMREHDQHPLYSILIFLMHGALAPLRATFPQVAVLNDAVIGWQTAAMLVALMSGLVVVVAMYVLASALFDRRVGIWAALLTALAAEFCQLSADALSDMTHLALFLLALAYAVKGLQRRSVWSFLGTGVLSGLAFLCRPEGAEVAVAASVVVLVVREWSWRQRIGCAAAVAIGALAVASPYMLITGTLVRKKPVSGFVSGLDRMSTECAPTGQWPPAQGCAAGATLGQQIVRVDNPNGVAAQRRMSHNPVGVVVPVLPVPRVAAARQPWAGEGYAVGVGDQEDRLNSIRWQHCAFSACLAVGGSSDLPKTAKAMWMIEERYAKSLRVTLLLPAIAYLIMTRRRRGVGVAGSGAAPAVGDRNASGGFVADVATRANSVSVPGGFDAVVLLFLLIVGMHVAIVIRLLFHFDYWEVFSIRHVLTLGAMTIPFSAAGLVMLLDLVPRTDRAVVGVMLLIGLIAPTAKWLFEARNEQDVYLRRAGEWIRRQQPSGAHVLTTRNMVPFYANGSMVWSPPEADVDRILAEARSKRPDWLVFDEKRQQKMSPTFFWRLDTAALPGETIDLDHRERQQNKDQLDVARVYRYRGP